MFQVVARVWGIRGEMFLCFGHIEFSGIFIWGYLEVFVGLVIFHNF